MLCERDYSYETKEVIDIPANKCHQEDALFTEISKLVMRLGRHDDQDEREVDGAVHRDSTGPRMRNAFLKHGSSEFSDLDWINYIFWKIHTISVEIDSAWVVGSRRSSFTKEVLSLALQFSNQDSLLWEGRSKWTTNSSLRTSQSDI